MLRLRANTLCSARAVDSLNPTSALRCDCGYDFQSRKVQDSYLSSHELELARTNRTRWIPSAVLLGIFVALLIGLFRFQPVMIVGVVVVVAALSRTSQNRPDSRS